MTGKRLGFLAKGSRDTIMMGDSKEKSQGADGLIVGGPGNLLDLNEMEQISADLLGGQEIRREVVEACQIANALHIDGDGFGGAIAQLQITDETLTQGCHSGPPVMRIAPGETAATTIA